MLKTTRSHRQFQDFLKEQLQIHYLKRGFLEPVLLQQKALASVWCSDLSKITEFVAHRYSQSVGSIARDPADMFRSLLLMELLHERSIDTWVHSMRSTPIFAVLSGFLPDDVPGVGTFYDFIKRLWMSSSTHLANKVRRPRRKPKKGKKKGEKSPLKKPGVIKRLVDRYLEHPPDFHSRPQDLFQKIFKECFVVPSAKHGILGDISALTIAGDGSSVRTGASHYGKLICSCRENGVFKCRCPRKFSDPDSSWGWDSYREEYYFGRTLYAFTAADSPYDLPVYLHFFKANRHDSLAFVYSFFDFIQSNPDCKVAQCLLDSAHDAYAIYNLLHRYDIAAFIDLNTRNEGNCSHQDEILFSKEGIPICPANHIMAYNGFCKDRQRHKWRCPKTRKTWKVSCESPCSDSPYGRVFYTREQDNLRFFTRVPRASALFKARYRQRTASERCFKRLKEDYLLERKTKTRNSCNWYFRAYSTAMCSHMDAWIKHLAINMRPLILEWSAEVFPAIS
ncbi:hypothetical protein SPACI_046830 [Sporomusa acidovorans DSM 3132]|uniref:Transposase DDE domain protein n=1 Tax=Sporomusa acidovorans (strain ATCC 49682 / DSM 3132 / Mol) TaxID=1123286 RepID=A0ABZ3J1R1_SPOA4|nr:hypothetical protein [Sporomusa acidovorans]OZC14309.1 hypothetical protein SPACI_52820 [Sporomusa acidovorans DSM 3132]